MKKNKMNGGFTLVEMMIAISITTIIFSFLGEFLVFALKAYNVTLENSEAMTKITPVIKRIEAAVVENTTITYSAIKNVYPQSGTKFTGIEVGENENHWYWWDKNGTGVMIDPTATGTSKSIYRSSSTAAPITISTQPLLISNGTVPTALQGPLYTNDWNQTPVKINDFYFVCYEDTPTGLNVWSYSAANIDKIRYVKLHIEMVGTRENTNFAFDTGFFVR